MVGPVSGVCLVHRGDFLVALRLAHAHRFGGDAAERDVEVGVLTPVPRLVMSCAADKARSHGDVVLRGTPTQNGDAQKVMTTDVQAQ